MESHPPSSRLYRATALGAWIVIGCVTALLVALETERLEREAMDVALERGATLFRLIETTRAWNAGHGGVYVPIGPRAEPNPYLEMPERDVETTDGKTLTLVNPAYMTRQIAELAAKREGARIHITSLKPIRPANAAEPWEKAALERFETSAARHYVDSITIDGKPFYRYMAPLLVQQVCLKCHEAQGYKLGDIRGGISITMPSDQASRSLLDSQRNSAAVGALVFLLLGGLSHLVLHRHRLILRRLSALTENQEREIRLRTGELARERARYQLMAEMASDWFWEQDANYRFTSFSGDHYRKGGLPLERLMGKTRWEIPLMGVSPEELAHHRAVVEAHRAFEGFEYQILNCNNEMRWYAISGRPVFDDDGTFRGYLGTGIDVTARKRREQMLHTLTEDTATVFGHRFFATLATGLRRLMGVRYCIISRITEGGSMARVVEHSDAGGEHALSEYPVTASPCSWVLEGDICVFPESADEAFPNAALLKTLGASSYIGVPIGAGAHPQGVVAILDPEPMRLERDLTELMKIFAARAALEFERMDAEDALRESARLLNLAEQMANVGSWQLDFSDRSLLWSEETFQIFELDRRSFDCTEANYIARIHPGDRQLVSQAFDAAVCNRAPFEVEHRIVTLSGRHKTVLQRGEIRYGIDGMPSMAQGMIQDITARRAAEAKLALAASVFSATHDGVLITDTSGNIIDANPSLCRMSGFEYRELIGHNPRLFRSRQQDADYYRQMWEALSACGHWEGELWNCRKDGSEVPERLSISAVLNDTGDITHYIGVYTDISALKAHQQELERQALHDALTGLPNRRLLIDRLHQALAQARRTDAQVAVAFLDLDGFKAVNDRIGHEAGDDLLVAIAERLQGAIREGDTVARLGGDEFVLLLVGLRASGEVAGMLDRILDEVARPVPLCGEQARVGASIGVALYPEDGDDAESLLQHADMAMYEAKHAGRHRYRMYRGCKEP
ncbi:MAG: diguanylate cyclase [Rhodocyclaceae bacterium]|nr:diguanylate cyclase [Rhodocyclaceae bacterium]